MQLYTSNSYTAHVPTIPVHLRLRQGGEPVADEPFEVEGTTPLIEGTTDGDGILEFELPATRREAVVHMTQQQRRYRLRIGNLDPADHDSGVRARLRNLGFLHNFGTRQPLTAQARAAQLAAAVRRFQASHDLPETGEIDDTTRSALQAQQGA